MDVFNVVDKIYTATINFVRRFNNERSCLQIKSILITITTSKQEALIQAN